MSYQVKLQIFEGPLDLLLYLIKKSEIDISDIPIAEITDQYLEYLEFLRMLDVNIAGEYLVVSATLLYIKSRTLLPPEEVEAEEGEEMEDPRQDLVRRLMEYKAFKEAAETLHQRELGRQDVYTRRSTEDDTPERESFFEPNLFDLISAFAKVLKEVPRETFHQVIQDEVSVEAKIHEILHRLVEHARLSFAQLFAGSQSRMHVVATFLAVLELIRLQEISVRQWEPFGEIEIARNEARARVRPRHVTEVHGAEPADSLQSSGSTDSEG